MGATLVVWALARRPELDLSPRARLVLVRMCVTAVDADVAPWYGAGWVLLADALGLDGKTGQVAVHRALRELRDSKLIELDRGGVHGRRARYLLHVRPWDLDTAP